MDGDSNRMRKAHSHRLESFAVGTKHRSMEDPIINLGLTNLEGVIALHEDALVI